MLRLLASQRSLAGLGQQAYTLRSGLRLDWYIISDLLLDMELGYEYLLQDFADEDFEVRQAFMVMGLRKRF